MRVNQNAPRTTNGIKRVNQDSEASNQCSLLKAMEHLYKNDKVTALSYNIAAEKKATETIRMREGIMQLHLESTSVCRTYKKMRISSFGLPDKCGHFSGMH